VSKHQLKEVKASGGCHRFGKEFFVQAQSRIRTQLCRGIIDKDKEKEEYSVYLLAIVIYQHNEKAFVY